MPSWVKRWMFRPRTELPSEPVYRRKPSATTPAPSSMMTGWLPLSTKLSSVRPSMSSAWLTGGRWEAGAMVCASVPAMPKTILSGVAPLAVLLVAVIASRSEMRPSAPRLLPRLVMEVVVPSSVSAVVSTTTTPLAVAITFIANSEVAP